MALKYQHHGGLSPDFLIHSKNIYNIKLNEQKRDLNKFLNNSFKAYLLLFVAKPTA